MFGRKPAKRTDRAEETLITNFSPKSRYAESYRTFRTNLQFALMEKELTTLLVTSSLENEGKTNTSANIGHSFAQAGKSVLMVDLDLRKPGLSERFSVRKENGFTEMISEFLGTAANEGSLSEYSLGDLLHLTKFQSRTGTLALDDGENQVDLLFEEGDLCHLVWRNRPENKKLANVLIGKELLTRGELELATGKQIKSDEKLGAILVTMGLVPEKELKRITSLHVMEAFSIAINMAQGAFQFFQGSEGAMIEKGHHEVDFQQLYSEFMVGSDGLFHINRVIDSVILETGTDNLYILPSGKLPPNPSELIGSSRVPFLLNLLKQKFDVIIIDSAPIAPVSDSLHLANIVDGVVIVVKQGYVNKKVLKDVTEQINRTSGNLMGVILNQMDVKKTGYYRYYGKYYSSYYE